MLWAPSMTLFWPTTFCFCFRRWEYRVWSASKCSRRCTEAQADNVALEEPVALTWGRTPSAQHGAEMSSHTQTSVSRVCLCLRFFSLFLKWSHPNKSNVCSGCVLQKFHIAIFPPGLPTPAFPDATKPQLWRWVCTCLRCLCLESHLCAMFLLHYIPNQSRRVVSATKPGEKHLPAPWELGTKIKRPGQQKIAS